MTTPRIEEMARKIMADNGGIDEVDDPKLFRDIVNALTQAHQAGIDKAVEVGYKKALREIDIGSHNYVQSRRAISELSGKPMMALTFDEHLDAIRKKIQALDDTIKTLQDNK